MCIIELGSNITCTTQRRQIHNREHTYVRTLIEQLQHPPACLYTPSGWAARGGGGGPTEISSLGDGPGLPTFEPGGLSFSTWSPAKRPPTTSPLAPLPSFGSPPSAPAEPCSDQNCPLRAARDICGTR